MKKKLAVLLCSVLCVSAFTGCSRTELAYLQMSQDLMNTMSSCVVEGSVQADVDFDALYEFKDDVAKATHVNIFGGNSEQNAFSGQKKLTVTYDMNMNIDALEYDMAFDVNYDGKTYDFGKMYYSLQKGVYVTSDTLWNIYQLYRELYAGDMDQYMVSDAYAEDLKDILAEERYIELLSAEDLTGVDMEEAVPQQDMKKLFDAAITFYKDMLEGFETGMVKEINGGYRIKADGRQAAQLLADFLYFAADNPDRIIDATEAYMTAVMDAVDAGSAEEIEMAKAEMESVFMMARESREDFVAAASQMGQLLESMMQDPGVAMMLDGFHYVGTVKKAYGDFVSTTAYTLEHEGEMICSLVTDSVMKKADAQIFFPARSMTLDELKGNLADLENKYNPVTGVSVTWGSFGENEYADIITMRSLDEVVYFHSGYNWSEIIIENGRAYLPLRVITESLGEEVGWENSTKTPYVMQNGERIDMRGKLQDDRAFVGIRDFEKLGYTVTYTFHKDEFDSLFDYKEVRIEK